MGSSSPNTFMRVMQARRGLPLISIEHEPHLPALQFQRSARSLACWAWMRCSTSSTTIPGSTSMSNCLKSPPPISPRQTLKTRFAIAFHSFCSERRSLRCFRADRASGVSPRAPLDSLLGRYLLHVRADLPGLEVLDLGIGDRDQVGRPPGPPA